MHHASIMVPKVSKIRFSSRLSLNVITEAGYDVFAKSGLRR